MQSELEGGAMRMGMGMGIGGEVAERKRCGWVKLPYNRNCLHSTTRPGPRHVTCCDSHPVDMQPLSNNSGGVINGLETSR